MRIACVAAVLTACLGPAAAAEPLSIDCSGPVTATSTPTSLAKALGRANVAVEKVDGAEGEQISATVLHPKDPAARIEVVWSDDEKKTGPQAMIRGESKASVAGLSIGSDLAAVEAANRKAFTLSGFGWDMGGNVTDWKGGALAKLPGGCFLSVQFTYAEDAPETAVDKASGDRSFASTDKAIRAVRPVVQSLTLGWPAK